MDWKYQIGNTPKLVEFTIFPHPVSSVISLGSKPRMGDRIQYSRRSLLIQLELELGRESLFIFLFFIYFLFSMSFHPSPKEFHGNMENDSKRNQVYERGNSFSHCSYLPHRIYNPLEWSTNTLFLFVLFLHSLVME